MTDDDESVSGDELRALTDILEAFRKLAPGTRQRVFQTVATYFELSAETLERRQGAYPQSPDSVYSSVSKGPSFSEDRSISAKQFLLEKQPRTDVERVACLAYYLTYYQNTPHFKTLDISKLNTEAAQAKFSNAAVAVDNATKQNYLAPASKGNKQLSALGEQFVLALPDRERAKTIMTNARPRRKARKGSASSIPESELDPET